MNLLQYRTLRGTLLPKLLSSKLLVPEIKNGGAS